MKGAAGREPTRGQLLAMAYVDGELAESAHQKFEDRLRREPALMREVAELKMLLPLLAGDLGHASPLRLHPLLGRAPIPTRNPGASQGSPEAP